MQSHEGSIPNHGISKTHRVDRLTSDGNYVSPQLLLNASDCKIMYSVNVGDRRGRLT